MTIEALIEKGIAGGWEPKHLLPNDTEYWGEAEYALVLLQPAFWRAVGKEMGWPDLKQPYQTGNGEWHEISWWEYKLHEMIRSLVEADANGIPQEEAINRFIETL